MISQIVRFGNLALVGLMAGILLSIWLGNSPKLLPYPAYTVMHRGLVASYNVLMPMLGLLTIVLTLLSAYLQKDNKPVMIVLIIAGVLLIVAGLITRLGNQPLNDLVMSWDLENSDTSWMTLRDKWWSLHLARMLTTGLSFLLVAATNIWR